MTKMEPGKCSKTSLSTAHSWKVVGLLQDTPVHIRVIYACEACSCWTYHEMDFVGFKMSSASDRKAEAEET